MSDGSKQALGRVLLGYDNLLRLFNESEVRDMLKQQPDNAKFREIRQQCEAIAKDVQDGLVVIFFDDPVFKDKVRKYCVF